MNSPLSTASAALDVVNKGIETIKLVLRPGTELSVVEGGFAKCLPEGVSDKDFEGGDDIIAQVIASEYAGESQRAILGDTLGGFIGAAWKWKLFFTWKANVREPDGTGAYILDASVDVSSTLASDQIAWEWKCTFPGKGRWHDRDEKIVELPYKLNIKCTHSVIYDKLWYEAVYRGWIRGDGTASCTLLG